MMNMSKRQQPHWNEKKSTQGHFYEQLGYTHTTGRVAASGPKNNILHGYSEIDALIYTSNVN